MGDEQAGAAALQAPGDGACLGRGGDVLGLFAVEVFDLPLPLQDQVLRADDQSLRAAPRPRLAWIRVAPPRLLPPPCSQPRMPRALDHQAGEILELPVLGLRAS